MSLSKIKHFIVPQDVVFFDLLYKHASATCVAAEALAQLLREYEKVEEKAKQIKELESEGDQLLHDIYAHLNTTFIVPIDHSDISALATALDDVLDGANAAAKYLAAYEVDSPSESMVQLADLLAQQTQELKTAVESIKTAKTYSRAAAACVEINRLENEADEVYTRAIAALFKQDCAVDVLKQKEVIDRIEAATDSGEKAANVISDIVMKHA